MCLDISADICSDEWATVPSVQCSAVLCAVCHVSVLQCHLLCHLKCAAVLCAVPFKVCCSAVLYHLKCAAVQCCVLCHVQCYVLCHLKCAAVRCCAI